MTNVVPMRYKYDNDLLIAVAKLFNSLDKNKAAEFISEGCSYYNTGIGLVPASYVDFVYPHLVHKIASYEGPIFDEIFRANIQLKKGKQVKIEHDKYKVQRQELSRVWKILLPYAGDEIAIWIENECYLNALFGERDIAIHLYEDAWQLSARKASCTVSDFRVIA